MKITRCQEKSVGRQAFEKHVLIDGSSGSCLSLPDAKLSVGLPNTSLVQSLSKTLCFPSKCPGVQRTQWLQMLILVSGRVRIEHPGLLTPKPLLWVLPSPLNRNCESCAFLVCQGIFHMILKCTSSTFWTCGSVSEWSSELTRNMNLSSLEAGTAGKVQGIEHLYAGT